MILRSAVVLMMLAGQLRGGLSKPKGEHTPPGIPASEVAADHPVKVRILTTMRHQDEFGVHGYGSGNLLGETTTGFDYKFRCIFGFLHNEKPNHADGEFYQGKWIKQDKKIEILTQQPGSTHVDKCELEIKPAGKAYDKDNPPPPAKE